MWIDWKKKRRKLVKLRTTCVGRYLFLYCVLYTGQALSLPDIPSFNDCPDIVFNSGFGNDSDPSLGVGGNYPGSLTRSVFSNGANRSYFISIPDNYNPSKAMPLLFSWHGAAGAGTALTNAQGTRDFWKSYANEHNFIVVAQVGTGSAGGGFTFPNDIAIVYDILTDMQSHYNIENKRIYGHGFSSGAHVLHTLMLFYNQGYAAYAISAGTFADAMFEDPSVPANSEIVPVFVSVGQADPMLATIQSERTKFLNAGWIEGKNYWLDIFNGGHQLDADVPAKSWEELCLMSN